MYGRSIHAKVISRFIKESRLYLENLTLKKFYPFDLAFLIVSNDVWGPYIFEFSTHRDGAMPVAYPERTHPAGY